LDILYIDIVLGLKFWVLQEGGCFWIFFKKNLGKGVRVVVCFVRIFYFIGWGKKDFWTWCGEWIVHVHSDSGLSMQGREGDLFSFQPMGRVKVPCSLSLGGGKDFFPCFPMCSHGVPSKFPKGSQYVPQVHNVEVDVS